MWKTLTFRPCSSRSCSYSPRAYGVSRNQFCKYCSCLSAFDAVLARQTMSYEEADLVECVILGDETGFVDACPTGV